MTREMPFGQRMFQSAIDDQSLQMHSKQQLFILKSKIILILFWACLHLSDCAEIFKIQ